MKHSTRLKFEDIGKTILYGIGLIASVLFCLYVAFWIGTALIATATWPMRWWEQL